MHYFPESEIVPLKTQNFTLVVKVNTCQMFDQYLMLKISVIVGIPGFDATNE